MGGDALAGKVTASLAESSGSLPLGGWLNAICGLTACTLGSAPGPTLGNEYGRTLPFNRPNWPPVFLAYYAVFVISFWHHVSENLFKNWSFTTLTDLYATSCKTIDCGGCMHAKAI